MQSLYLDEGLEKEVGIVFEDVRDSDLDVLRSTIRVAANVLRAEECVEIAAPVRGFLREPLTDEQRKCLNHMLGASYAEDSARQQQELMLIPVEECKDPMVPLKRQKKAFNVDVEFSESENERVCKQRERVWWLRRQAALSLFKALNAFNLIGIRPHLEDCFRPREVQEALFIRRVARTAQMHPTWTHEQVGAFARSVTASAPAIAGHQAGAAVDLRLKNAETGEFLPLGNGYPEGGVISHINCPYVTREQYETRMIFSSVLRMAEFKLLPTENWHASFGDRGMGIDGPAKKLNAIYGPIRCFDEKTGKIHPYQASAAGKEYLSDDEMIHLIDLARAETRDGGILYMEEEAVDLFRYYRNSKTWSRIDAITDRLSKTTSPVEEQRDDY